MNWTLLRRRVPRVPFREWRDFPRARPVGRQTRAERRVPIPARPSRHLGGRHPDSDIFLDDVTVSRRHAEFRLESGEFSVVDVGSLNGTYANREPVDSAVLANGDEVQIGKFRLVFLTGPKGDDDGAPQASERTR